MDAKRHPNESQEGEVHNTTWRTTSQCCQTQNGNKVPYKHYGTYSNEVLPKYFNNTTKDMMQTCHEADASILGAKRHPNEPKKGPTVAIVVPMLQKIAKDAPQSIIVKTEKMTRLGIEPRPSWTYTSSSNQLSYQALLDASW